MVHLTKKEIINMQIKRIEKEIRDLPYHKGTEHHIGKLKARLAKLKESLDQAGEKSGGGGGGYAVKKQGDATVVLVGPPSSGKSTLLNALTNAESKVAPYAFTTLSVIPGMMKYNDAYIQILDVPGLIEGAEEGKGRGREVLSVVRGADLIILMSDVGRPQAIKRMANALENNGIRINKKHPSVRVEKRLSGGLLIKTNLQHEIDKETIRDIAFEYGIKSAEITISEKISIDSLIDAFSKNRVYIPAIKVLNKLDELKESKDTQYVYISADKQKGLNVLRKQIWNALGLVKIYLVRKDQDPDHNNPMVVKQGMTMAELSETIGSDFSQNKTRAKIWGTGAKFPGQEVSLKTKVLEGMQIRFL